MRSICLSTLVFAATGCSAASDGDFSSSRLTMLDDQHFAVHAKSGPDAIVSATGELSMGGKQLALDRTQRDSAIRYFASASALRRDGIATGMAGASTAMTAIGSVVSGFANGEPDKIGPAVEAKAADVRAHAEKMCRDLRDLAATQDTLAASLPAFRSYALIESKDVADCHAG
jgi:hypothetical protein